MIGYWRVPHNTLPGVTRDRLLANAATPYCYP